MLGLANVKMAVRNAEAASSTVRKKTHRARAPLRVGASKSSARNHQSNISNEILPESNDASSSSFQESISRHQHRRASNGSANSVKSASLNSSAYSRRVGSSSSSAPNWPAPRPSSLRSSSGSPELKKKKAIKKPQARPSATPPTKEIWRDKKAEQEFLNPTFGPDSVPTEEETDDSTEEVPNAISFKDSISHSIVSYTEHEHEEFSHNTTESYQHEQNHSQQVGKAEQLLRGMDQALEALILQEQELTKGIKTHRIRAQGRYDASNIVGAALSLRKLERSQAQLTRVVLAMDELENKRDQVAFLVAEFRSVRSLQIAAEQEEASAVNMMNLIPYLNYDKEMKQALEQTEAKELTDQELVDKYLRNQDK